MDKKMLNNNGAAVMDIVDVAGMVSRASDAREEMVTSISIIESNAKEAVMDIVDVAGMVSRASDAREEIMTSISIIESNAKEAVMDIDVTTSSLASDALETIPATDIEGVWSNDLLLLFNEDNQYFHTAHNVVMSIVEKHESESLTEKQNQTREDLVNFWYPKIKNACQEKNSAEINDLIFHRCFLMKEVLTATIINEVSIHLV
jgi:hypothetical protein